MNELRSTPTICIIRTVIQLKIMKNKKRIVCRMAFVVLLSWFHVRIPLFLSFEVQTIYSIEFSLFPERLHSGDISFGQWYQWPWRHNFTSEKSNTQKRKGNDKVDFKHYFNCSAIDDIRAWKMKALKTSNSNMQINKQTFASWSNLIQQSKKARG